MDDWLSTMQMSKCSASATRSMGSSLLTVSDLEEDLRAASAFLSSNKGQLISKCLLVSSNLPKTHIFIKGFLSWPLKRDRIIEQLSNYS